MKPRTRDALVILTLGAALGGGAAWLAQRGAPGAPVGPAGRPRALDAIPAGALLVGSADLRALRASPVGAPFFREGREIRGVGKVRDVCGFDPIDTLDEIALAVPATGDGAEIGLSAAGEVRADALVDCASKVIQARGGRPVVTPIGSFRTVRDVNAPAGGELAVRAGGPVLLGGGSYLRAMIDAADGRAAGIGDAHASIERQVTGRAARLTVVLTPEQRRQIADELALGGAPTAPAGSILGAGLGLELGPKVGLHAVIACAAAPPCAALADRLRAARDARVEDLGARLTGLAGILQRVELSAQGEAVHLKLELPAEDAAALVEMLLSLRNQRAAPPPEPEPPPPSAPPEPEAAPDAGEIIRPRKPRERK